MNMNDLKKVSMVLTIVITLGGALSGMYSFAYNAGHKVGSAETKSSSITDLMRISTSCDDRIEGLRDKLFDCRTNCR